MAEGAGILEGVVESSLDTTFEVPGLSGFEVISAHVVEGLSERTRASVEVGCGDDVDWSQALLQNCRLSIDRIEQGTRMRLASRAWTLRLGEVEFIEHKDSAFRFVVKLFDPLWPLGLGLDTRKFRNTSARDIVSQILDEARIPYEFRLSADLPMRKYTAQYRESKLAFIERLMEFEGIFYQFTDDGTVVFCDSSVSAERLRGGAAYPLIESGGGMARNEVGLSRIRRGRRVTTGKVTLGDYNWKRPDVTLCSSADGDGDVSLERYVFPAGFRKPDQGGRLAQLRVEAYRARATFLEGKGNDPAFAPGLGFALGSELPGAFGGEYVLTRIEHTARTGAYTKGAGDEGAAKASYEATFEAIPIDRPFRPIPTTPRPTVSGVHSAMVRGPSGEEIHTDEYGRFKAQLHWDREAKGTDDDSRWIRVIQETTSSMTLARVGWEMMLGYIDGDPDRPMGLGRAINGQMTPTYGQPANSAMMAIKTMSSPAGGGGGGGGGATTITLEQADPTDGGEQR